MKKILYIFLSIFLWVPPACSQEIDYNYCALEISSEVAPHMGSLSSIDAYRVSNFISRTAVEYLNVDVFMYRSRGDGYLIVASTNCEDISASTKSEIVTRLNISLSPVFNNFSLREINFPEYNKYVSAINSENSSDFANCSVELMPDSLLNETFMASEALARDAALAWEITLSGGFLPLDIMPSVDGMVAFFFESCDRTKPEAFLEILSHTSGKSYLIRN